MRAEKTKSRKSAALALAVALTLAAAGPALAGSRSVKGAGAGGVLSLPAVWAQVWGALVGVWGDQGHAIDPDGAASTAADQGHAIDPDGGRQSPEPEEV
jgi:hypothetical protein